MTQLLTIDPDPTAPRLAPPSEMLARLDDGREVRVVFDAWLDETHETAIVSTCDYPQKVLHVPWDRLRPDTSSLDGGGFPWFVESRFPAALPAP